MRFRLRWSNEVKGGFDRPIVWYSSDQQERSTTPGHYNYWFNHSHPFGGIYDYDPTDDGPECEVITRILAKHPLYMPGAEKKAIHFSRILEVAALALHHRPFSNLRAEEQAIIRSKVARTMAAKGLA
jgi:hypothetical protein